jgi:hypothetical protein
MLSRIVSPSSDASKVIVSPAPAAAMADLRVIVPLGGVALSSRESTTSPVFGLLSFVAQPPARRARASGKTQSVKRVRFIGVSPFPFMPLV